LTYFITGGVEMMDWLARGSLLGECTVLADFVFYFLPFAHAHLCLE